MPEYLLRSSNYQKLSSWKKWAKIHRAFKGSRYSIKLNIGFFLEMSGRRTQNLKSQTQTNHLSLQPDKGRQSSWDIPRVFIFGLMFYISSNDCCISDVGSVDLSLSLSVFPFLFTFDCLIIIPHCILNINLLSSAKNDITSIAKYAMHWGRIIYQMTYVKRMN